MRIYNCVCCDALGVASLYGAMTIMCVVACKMNSYYCEVVRMMFSVPKNNSALFDSRDCLPGLDLPSYFTVLCKRVQTDYLTLPVQGIFSRIVYNTLVGIAIYAHSGS